MSFDRLARHYEVIERCRFWSKLWRWRVHWLKALPLTGNILFLGDGDGRLLAGYLDHIVTQIKPAEAKLSVTSIDSSRRMLAMQRLRLTSHPLRQCVSFVHGDATQQLITDRYDLIVTPFFLDCFCERELERMIKKLFNCLKPGGVWYVVDFCYPNRGPFRLWAKGWLFVMHQFFRRTTGMQSSKLTEPDPFLSEQGLIVSCDARDGVGWLRATIFQRPI